MRCWLAATLWLAGCKVTLMPDQPRPEKDPSAYWELVLFEVVTDDGYVDYDRLEARRGALDDYVSWLTKAKPPRTKDQRYAWWFNNYNALVLYAVLEEGRPASVLDVPARGFWPGGAGSPFFQQRQFKIGLDRNSLAEIEHERLRGRRQDIRIHGALNCASMSCPPLRAELYSFIRLDQQLDEQMTRWINDPERGVRVEDGIAVMSPIFDWYARDFDIWTAGDDLCTTAAYYADEPLAGELRDLADQGCPHRFFEYDWSLNHKPIDKPVRGRSQRAPEPLPSGDTGTP